MKLRVLRHSLRGGRGVLYGIGVCWGIVAGVVCAGLIGAHPGPVTVGTDIASALFAVWTLGWLCGPILTGGGDETLRPENFALLPIRPVVLARGLLGASMVGAPPLATLLAFSGLLFLALPVGAGTAGVAVVAVGLQLALAVLLSRAVVAGLGALLGTRKGKDLGVLLAALVGLLYLPAQALFNALGPLVVGQTSAVLTGTLRALPTGWGPAAVAASSTGDWTAALAWLGALAVLDGLLLLAWSRLLVRRLTTGGSTGGARGSGPVDGGRRWSPKPAGPLGAVIDKELRMWWRDARRRAALVSGILLGLLLPFLGHTGSPKLAASALWIVFFAAMQASNLYGYDGTSVWQTLTTPGAARFDVRGRQWAWTLIVGPVTLVAAVVLPLVTDSPGAYPWVLSLAPALLGGGAGTVVLVSVLAPAPLPTQRQGNPFAASTRLGGFGVAMSRVALSLLQLAAALPVLVLLAVGEIADLPVVTWLAVPVGVASGVGTAWWWGRRAHRRLADRGPELLAALR
jgi:ABC-2 type transport system permease protein